MSGKKDLMIDTLGAAAAAPRLRLSLRQVEVFVATARGGHARQPFAVGRQHSFG